MNILYHLYKFHDVTVNTIYFFVQCFFLELLIINFRIIINKLLYVIFTFPDPQPILHLPSNQTNNVSRKLCAYTTDRRMNERTQLRDIRCLNLMFRPETITFIFYRNCRFRFRFLV